LTFQVAMGVYCLHFRADDLDGNYCMAFPDGDGIPDAIFDEGAPHFEPFPGDHGIQFAPESGWAARVVERMFGRHQTVGNTPER
jgi:hypothetical protein